MTDIQLLYRYKRANSSRITVLNIRKLYLYFILYCMFTLSPPCSPSGKWCARNTWKVVYLLQRALIYIWSEIFRSPSEAKYMAAMEALSYVGFSPPTRSFMFTCYVKIAQGAETDVTQGLHGHWPPYLAFLPSGWPEDLNPYIYIWSSLICCCWNFSDPNKPIWTLTAANQRSNFENRPENEASHIVMLIIFV